MKSCFPLIGLSFLALNAQELELKLDGPNTELSWDRTFPPSSGVPSQIQSRIFSSSDLRNWVEDSTLTLDESSGNGISTISLASPDAVRFYRLEQFLSYLHRGDEGAPPAVYGQQLINAKQSLGGLTLQKFSTPPEAPGCLAGIGWDPSTANYFDDYNTSPDDYNATLLPGDPERRYTDFRLNEAELAKFQQNGFVVAPRVNLIVGPEPFGEHPTPVDFYYKIWTDDLPVFITADSVLDAWHETFLGMLEEIEEFVLYPKVRQLAVGLSDLSLIEREWADEVTPGADHVRQAIADLNLYLGTARSLLLGYDDSAPSSDLSLPNHWYQAAKAHTATEKTGLYGDVDRIEDMTLFTPRGHYTNSQVLTAYFQGFLWLSRAQFQIASSTPTAQSDRELRAAILLALQVRDRGYLTEWQEIENFVRSLNGQSDAMTVVEMTALLESLNLDNVDAIASDTDLATIRNTLLSSSYGVQEIDGGQSATDCDPIDYELPRVLSLIGQRWTPDAWTFNQVVFPQVKDEGVASYRRVPSGLDAAYAVFGNDTALPILADRMTDTEGVPFRDGYPYHENLAAARSVFDSQQEEFWTEHTYGSWLHSLRALSTPVTSSAPDTFRTTAWKRRILNTQLASWSQLRHDTLLYAEQSFTPPVICEFPDGYVDPYPQLWNRLANMALQYKDLLSTLNYPAGEFWIEARSSWWEPTISIQQWNASRGYKLRPTDVPNEEVIVTDRSTRIAVMCDHLENFSVQCFQLQTIAEQQLAGLEHTAEMKGFIKHTVENFSMLGCNSERTYTGWFPNLYFMPVFSAPEDHPSALWNPVVADVHTDSADVCSGDPGAILHVGTGRAIFMLTAVKHPDGTSCAYGGPVMSHYEFLTTRDVRLNDAQWLQKLEAGEEPEFETWKHDFLVPE
ncbi:DUF3160 domain-containing protein [Verrucomicrobiaceae bacterium 227]